MPADWFRTTSWGDEATAEFEAKLARSALRNRPQYLRVKAIALDGAGLTKVAGELLLRVINEYPDSLDYAHALELRGDMFRRSGELAAAEDCYRTAIARRPDLNATSGTVPLSLAEVLLKRHGDSAVPEVRSLLAYPQMRLTFNSQLVRALVISARAAETVGDDELRLSEAHRALALLGAAPQLKRHPDVGVPRLDDDELGELRRLATRDVALPRSKRSWLRRS